MSPWNLSVSMPPNRMDPVSESCSRQKASDYEQVKTSTHPNR